MMRAVASAVPSGLATTEVRDPNVETLGYCRPSLRDEAASFASRSSAFPTRASRWNPLCLQIRLQFRGDDHAAVGLLIGFDQGDKQSCQRRTASVEDVRKFVFALVILEAKLHPARLKIFAIRAT